MKLSAGTKEKKDPNAAENGMKLRLVTQPPARRSRFTIGVCEQVFSAEKRSHVEATRIAGPEARSDNEAGSNKSDWRIHPQILMICTAVGLVLGYLVGRRRR